jgi:hypothetical protein
MVFRYIDRYSNSLGALWDNPHRVDELLAALEERDQALEREVSEMDNYLPLTGGTISGDLAFTSPAVITWDAAGIGPPTLTTRSVGTKIVLYPSLSGVSVDFGLGIDSNVMWFSAGTTVSSFRWYLGTTAVFQANNAGCIVEGTRYFAFSTYGGGWFMQDTTWIRSFANKGVYINTGHFGGEGSITLGWGGTTHATHKVYVNGSGYFQSSMTVMTTLAVGGLASVGSLTATGQIQTNKSGLGGVWSDASMICNPGGGTANLALHCGGVAPQLGAVNGAGNNVYCRDANFSVGSANLVALGHIADSTRRIKRNIASWPARSLGAGAPSAVELVGRLKPVSFEAINMELEMDGEPHDCAKHECGGTKKHPCSRTLNRRKPRLGLIAEDVNDVLPEAVFIDEDGLPAGIDIAMLATAAIAAIKELTARIEQLEGVT